MEPQAADRGRIAERAAHGVGRRASPLRGESVERSAQTVTSPPKSNAPRAGQIYVDLRYMQALVTTPDRAVARLARRMRAKKTILSFKDKRPLKPPQPPSQNWRNRLTLPPSQEEWWQGFVVEPPKIPP